METNELLQDPRPHPKETQEPSLSEEIDDLLSQEYAISSSLSELDMMLRNLESEGLPINREEETSATKEEDTWKLIDLIKKKKKGGTRKPPRDTILKKSYSMKDKIETNTASFSYHKFP